MEKQYASLYRKSKEQTTNEIFAHFPYDGRNGEQYWTPFERLAMIAKMEDWDFKTSAFKSNSGDYPILRNYMNYTFIRVRQQNKIVFSIDGQRACFNTGLQTSVEKDIFATFYLNKQATERGYPTWTFYAFADSYSDKLKDFVPLPEIATYIEDSSDLVFDLNYEIEVNYDHIIEYNKERLPDIFQTNRQLALTAIQGATKFLKEKIRRNYKIAIPHWYDSKIQLLLPLNLLNESVADLALVAAKDKQRKIYRVTTALSMDMAYMDARLLCRPDKEWLNP